MAGSSSSSRTTTHATSLLTCDEIARLLAPYVLDNGLSHLLALLSCCTALRATCGIELDFARRDADWVLKFASRFEGRLQVVGVEASRVSQANFDELLAVPGLRKLTVRTPGSATRICSIAQVKVASALCSLRLVQGLGSEISDWSPLGGCSRLESLAVHGGIMESNSGLEALRTCSRLCALDLRKSSGPGLAEGLRGLCESSSSAAWSLDTLNLQARAHAHTRNTCLALSRRANVHVHDHAYVYTYT